jgi:hypothetical protein
MKKMLQITQLSSILDEKLVYPNNQLLLKGSGALKAKFIKNL